MKASLRSQNHQSLLKIEGPVTLVQAAQYNNYQNLTLLHTMTNESAITLDMPDNHFSIEGAVTLVQDAAYVRSKYETISAQNIISLDQAKNSHRVQI